MHYIYITKCCDLNVSIRVKPGDGGGSPDRTKPASGQALPQITTSTQNSRHSSQQPAGSTGRDLDTHNLYVSLQHRFLPLLGHMLNVMDVQCNVVSLMMQSSMQQ